MSLTSHIKEEFKRRVFDESFERIISCLNILSKKQVWYSPNKKTNSIGNLVLHLEGNANQWIIGSFGDQTVIRHRAKEFIPDQNLDKKELIKRLLELKSEMYPLIEALTETDLIKTYKVQVYNEKGVDILIHVIEHFSYHTGQVALLTKLIADKALSFYTYPLE